MSVPVFPDSLVFLGTPDLSVPFLNALVASDKKVVLVITKEDQRRGRGQNFSPSPVKKAAMDLGILVTHDMRDLESCGAQLGVVVAYGEFIPLTILKNLPMINVHFSLLPRWRGPSPVERAILSGDKKTGVCVIQVGNKFDIGDVYNQTEVLIDSHETSVGLKDKLVKVGVNLLLETLSTGLSEPYPQVGVPTWADKLTQEDRRLDWNQSVTYLERMVRVGGAWTTVKGRRLKIWKAEPVFECLEGPPGLLVGDSVIADDGVLRLIEVQIQDRSRQLFSSWESGARLESDTRLGQ